jgi:hypothetical protein
MRRHHRRCANLGLPGGNRTSAPARCGAGRRRERAQGERPSYFPSVEADIGHERGGTHVRGTPTETASLYPQGYTVTVNEIATE